MSPTSLDLLIVTMAAAVATTTFVAWAWSLNRRARWLIRPVLLALCLATSLAVVGVGVNRVLYLYPTWTEVFGKTPSVPTPETPEDTPVTAAPGQSRMDSFTPAAGKAGISLPVWVYLPPGYDQAEAHYPVIAAYAGFPGTPNTWISGTNVQKLLDTEIAEHRMAPTIVIFPTHHPDPKWDSECVDAVGGPMFDTYLSEDVPNAVKARYRARTDRSAWGVIGFSTGGYCAVNMVMRHPERFSVAASLAGYFTPYTGGPGGNQDLFKGAEDQRKANSPLWRLRNQAPPNIDIWYGSANDDARSLAAIKEFSAEVKPPLRLTTEFIPAGGHTLGAWLVLIPGALDWMSARLAAPQSLT